MKDDGLFAMRAKAGELKERAIAADLIVEGGHSFDPSRVKSPGYIEIYYGLQKRNRKSDLECLICGALFEVKRRLRDRCLRAPHSRRPLNGHSAPRHWHVWVFPDDTHAFVKNEDIIRMIQESQAQVLQDGTDYWAEFNPADLHTQPLPLCRSREHYAD